MHILFLVLVERRSKRKSAAKPAPRSFRSPGTGRAWLAILLVDASREPQERTRETACLSLRQQREVLLHLLGSTVLRGGWNLDMQLLPHCPRRIRSPPSLDFYYRQRIPALSNLKLHKTGDSLPIYPISSHFPQRQRLSWRGVSPLIPGLYSPDKRPNWDTPRALSPTRLFLGKKLGKRVCCPQFYNFRGGRGW